MGCGASRGVSAEPGPQLEGQEAKAGEPHSALKGPRLTGLVPEQVLQSLRGSVWGFGSQQVSNQPSLDPVPEVDEPASGDDTSETTSDSLGPRVTFAGHTGGTEGGQHAPAARRPEDQGHDWSDRPVLMSTIHELRAKEDWLVGCGVLQALALRMPPGPPTGSAYSFAARSRGWPAAFRGVEDEIAALVGEGTTQLIDAESHHSEQTSLSGAETSSVATASSEVGWGLVRAIKGPEAETKARSPRHDIRLAKDEVGLELALVDEATLVRREDMRFAGVGRREDMRYAGVGMPEDMRYAGVGNIGGEDMRYAGVGRREDMRYAGVGNIGGEDMRYAGVGNIGAAVAVGTRTSERGWDSTGEEWEKGASGRDGQRVRSETRNEREERSLSMIEARLSTLDRLQNLAEQVALEVEVARADLEKAIRSGDYAAQRTINSYMGEAEKLLGGVRRDILRLGGGRIPPNGPDDESMVQIRRRVKAIAKLQALAQETAMELEMARAELAAARSAGNWRQASQMEERMHTAEEVLELVKEDLLEIEAEMEGRSSKVLNSEMREKLELQLESRFRDKDPEQAKSSDYERRPLSIGPPPRADSSLSLLSLHPPKKMIKPPWLAFD